VNMTSENEDLYRRAIAAFGEEHQIHKAIEEMAELIVALNQWLKCPENLHRTRDVIGEIADVLITVGQMAWLFDQKAQANKLPWMPESVLAEKQVRLEWIVREEETRHDRI